jgi:hypothetical protein
MPPPYEPVPQAELARYTAYRATAPLTIDGDLTKPDWLAAPASYPFVDIVDGSPAWFDTRVRILWDDEHLYFGFTAEETHVWATFTQRDSKIWFDNDLEIFIAGPDAVGDCYYEFEVNALGTIYEVLWIWRDAHGEGRRFSPREWPEQGSNLMIIDGIGGHKHPRGERLGFLDWDLPGLRSAVLIHGTLNDPSDVDGGWLLEVALPWKSLALFGSVPPRHGDTWRIDCSRFQHIGRKGERLDPAAGWTWNRHAHYDSHIPEAFPFVQFSSRAVR